MIAQAHDGLRQKTVRLELEVLPQRTPGDLDGNGTVDAADLREMLAAFGTSDIAADLDGDGVATAADVSALIESRNIVTR